MKKNKFYYFLISGLAISVISISACKEKDDEDPKLPTIGGFNNSNEVAAANLKAHWTFDGTYQEDITKTAETQKVNSSFVPGIKGQAVSLNEGFIYYKKDLGKLTTGGAFTISSWIQVANNQVGVNGARAYFQSMGGNELFGNVTCMLETGQNRPGSDSLVAKALYRDANGGLQDQLNNFGDVGVDYQVIKGAGQNKWIQLITTYNPLDSNRLQIYANGVQVGNKKFAARGSSFKFNSPNEVVIGGWANLVQGTTLPPEGFTLPFLGKIDEVRVFDKLLSQTEIKALYDIELVGR